MFSAERTHTTSEQLIVLWTWLLEGYVPVVPIVADDEELEGIDEPPAAATTSRRRVIAAAATATLLAATSAESIAQAVPADLADARGAILVQVTDTSINPLPAEVVFPALGLGVRLSRGCIWWKCATKATPLPRGSSALAATPLASTWCSHRQQTCAVRPTRRMAHHSHGRDSTISSSGPPR